MNLAQYAAASNSKASKIADALDTSSQQRLKDLERLRILGCAAPSAKSTPPALTPFTNAAELKFSTKLSPNLTKAPSLSKKNFSFTVDLNSSAKSKAIELLKKKPIEKSNPNFIKHRGTETGKKRALEQLTREEEENAQKKQKLDTNTVDPIEQTRRDKIKRILEASSSHKVVIFSNY